MKERIEPRRQISQQEDGESVPHATVQEVRSRMTELRMSLLKDLSDNGWAKLERFEDEVVRFCEHLRSTYSKEDIESRAYFHALVGSSIDERKHTTGEDFSKPDSVQEFVTNLIKNYS